MSSLHVCKCSQDKCTLTPASTTQPGSAWRSFAAIRPLLVGFGFGASALRRFGFGKIDLAHKFCRSSVIVINHQDWLPSLLMALGHSA
jgi:hypothetical protein